MNKTTQRRRDGRLFDPSWATLAAWSAALAFTLAAAGGVRAGETIEAGAASTSSGPARPVAPPVDAAELARRFWLCDHAATRGLLDLETAMRCSRATDGLLALRFGGDFAAMLAWWRERKAAEHAAVDAAILAEARQRAAPPTSAPPTTAARALGSLDAATADELKAAYLYCDRLARTERFDATASEACSIVYEALKARVFGGSTDRVIAWMRKQHAAAAGSRAAAQP